METILLHENYSINEKGHFEICGHDTIELAEKFGTPLYVIDEDKVRKMCRTYKNAIKRHFDNSDILYASKALSFKGMYRIAMEEGMCVDAVSCGEIYTALKAGFPAERIYYHGNNKMREDIEFAVENKIGCFVADNCEELDFIDEAARNKGVLQHVLLRITPGIDPHTHAKIATGNVDSKFGKAIETGQALDFVKHALSKKNLVLDGIHCHVGSQSFDPEPFIDACVIMTSFAKNIKDQTGYEIKVLDLGGGFGVRYLPEQKDLDIEWMIDEIAKTIKESCAENGLDLPKIMFEPGRSLVAAAGVTLYTVGHVKEIKGYKNYIPVNGGMTDNPRYALYEAPYYCLIANKAGEKMDYHADVVGSCCESGDIIQPDVDIQKAQYGDILAVCVTGAYNYSMSSNYNRFLKPALVLVSKNKAEIAVKRETFEDLTRNDLLSL